MEIYPRRHFSHRSPYSAQVCELLLKAVKSGSKDAINALGTQGGMLSRNHPYVAIPADTGVPMITPTFIRLRKQEEEHAAASRGGTQGSLAAAPRQGTTLGRGENQGSPRREGPEYGPGSAATGCPRSSRLACRTDLLPPRCDYAWREFSYPRVNCQLAHEVTVL